MALRFKEGVRIDAHMEDGIAREAIQDETVAAILQVARIFDEILRRDCVVTSVNEGIHAGGNTHYAGLAADFRLNHLDKEDQSLKDFVELVVRKALNAATPPGAASLYDVVQEAQGTPANHLHVEFQPHAL
jgi:hypothetical protein